MADRQVFDQQIEVVYQRLHELIEQSSGSPKKRAALVEALKALSTSLEELHAAGEESRQQNEELTAARQSLDVEHKAVRAALGEERAFASAVLDTAGVLVVVLDRDGRIVRFNPACQQATGYAFEEVEGQYVWDFLLIPEEVEPVRATFDNLQGGQFPSEFENYWVARDGSRRLIAWTNTAIPGLGGRVEYIIGTGLDITARRQAESQREAALEEIRSLSRFPAENPNPVLRLDQTGSLLYANEASTPLLREWGCQVGDPLPPPWHSMVVEASAANTARTVDVPSGERAYSFDIVPIAGAGYVNLYGRDVTARRQAESQRGAALAERERLLAQARQDRESIATLAQTLERERDTLQTIMESTHVQLAYLDQAFTFVRVNAAYARGSGHSWEELIGHGHFDLFPNTENQAIFERVRDTGQPAVFHAKPFEYADQPERDVTYWDWTLVPVQEGDGRVRGLVLSLLDVTDQVRAGQERERLLAEVQAKNEELQGQAEELEAQAEELRFQTLNLEQERARLRAIIDSTPEAILVADERGEVMLANPAAAHLFAAPVPGASGLEYYGQVIRYRPDHTPYQPHERPCFRAAVHRETQRDLLIALLWPDGEWRDVLVNAAPILDSRGQLHGAVAVYQDITERVQAEGELKATLAEKEVLMREIYHRVKNNVQALIYLMDMQADYIPDESTRQMVRELQERARSMALVHEKLYQSQNLAQVDFGDYLHELVDNLSRVFGTNRSIVWRIKAEKALLSVESAIPCGLVATELLTNALKYAFPDGRPRVERGETECNIDVEFRADGERFTLIVADNGVGLPPGLDWTTTPSLGLQLINVLARHQLGGQVGVDTHAGTAFKITFAERKKG